MKVRAIRPHSRPHRFLKLDGRTKEAQLIATARAELVAHVGGSPSSVEQRIIDRAAVLTVHLELLDAKAFEVGGMSERDSRMYLAWSNTLTRTLRTLGLKGSKADRAPSLADYVADRRAASAAE